MALRAREHVAPTAITAGPFADHVAIPDFYIRLNRHVVCQLFSIQGIYSLTCRFRGLCGCAEVPLVLDPVDVGLHALDDIVVIVVVATVDLRREQRQELVKPALTNPDRISCSRSVAAADSRLGARVPRSIRVTCFGYAGLSYSRHRVDAVS